MIQSMTCRNLFQTRMGSGLGQAQQKMIEKMLRYGRGYYLPQWRKTYRDRQLLAGLVKRGIIEEVIRCDTVIYRLVNGESDGRIEN